MVAKTKMSLRIFLLCLAVSAGPWFRLQADSVAIYREIFSTSTNNAPLSFVGWKANTGPTGTNQPAWSALSVSDGASNPTNLEAINSFPADPALLATGWLYDAATNLAPQLLWTDEVDVDMIKNPVTQISWRESSDAWPTAGNAAHVAICVDGKWYASSRTFARTTNSWGALTLDFTTATWRTLNFTAGSVLSLGDETVLSGTKLESVGLYIPTLTDKLRIDTFEIYTPRNSGLLFVLKTRLSADVQIITQPGEQYDDAHRVWQGIPSIERTPGGRLIDIWYSGGDKEGSPENYCLVARSDDQGLSWTPPILVIQGITTNIRTGDPLPWLDPNGRMWLFWSERHSDSANRSGTWAIRCDQPDAATMKWSAPQFLGGGIVLGKPVILRSTGEWLIPFDLVNYLPMAAEFGQNTAGVMVSVDNGETWRWRGGWQLSSELHDFDEHCVVECSDGSLLASIRCKTGLLKSRSTDGGKTWTVPEPFMVGTCSRAHLRRLASGRLLLIYHDGPPGSDGVSYRREYLTAFLSEDDGATWGHKMLLDIRSKVSYPDATQGPDGRIFLTYDYNRYIAGCKQILFTSFTEEDVLTNKTAPAPVIVNQATGYGNIYEPVP